MPTTPVDIEFRNVIKEFPGRGAEAAFRAVDDISFTIHRGEFFALLGPSGCGKTTSLRMIAGFEDPTSGDVLLRGRPVQGVPPFHRPVNTVFQDYALFPHMSILQNVMFGLEMEGVSKAEARKRATEALEMVRLVGFDRKPRQLSGGQQQRVALARALVKRPAVLLLDEPLGALDLKLRKEMQFELAQIQHDLGITFIHVTHDQEEALSMADRIAVMNRGKILQIGSAEEIYETPATRFVADFIGETSFIEGTLVRDEGDYGFVRLNDGTVVKSGAREHNIEAGTKVTVAVRPEKVNLFATEGKVRFPDSTSDTPEVFKTNLLKDPDINLAEGSVKYANYIGTDTRYIIEFGGGHEVVARVQNFGLRSDTSFSVGQRVYVYFDADTARLLVE